MIGENDLPLSCRERELLYKLTDRCTLCHNEISPNEMLTMNKLIDKGYAEIETNGVWRPI